MFRKLTIALLFVIATVTQSFAAPKDVDVYIMRGLMGFLFTAQGGVYRMKDELAIQGYNVKFVCWQIPCRNDIVKSIKANPKRKFAIIGHSMGGNGITLIGPELEKAGIKVPYAAVIDAPVPQKLTGNFTIVDNFYQFNDFRDPILIPTNPKTKLTQFNYRKVYGHIEIADAKPVTDRIYSQLEKLARP